MRLEIGNVQTKVIVGGKDNLLGFDLMQTLREYLRMRPDGYHRSPLYKRRQWDGWRYFITPTGNMATGFVTLVVDYVLELGVEVEIIDNRKELPRMVKELSNDIGIIEGNQWDGRPYQMDMVARLDRTVNLAGNDFYFPRGIFDCATNAGKNSIAALIVKNLDRKYNTAFFVSSQRIYKQAVDFFTDAFGEPVGQIGDGKFKPSWFTVVMVKTMINRAGESVNAKKYLNDLDVLFVDEADEAGGDGYSKVLAKVGAGMRVFLSGTPLDANPVSNMVAIGLSGGILGKITNKFLIDNGYSQKPVINILLNAMPHDVVDYDTELYQNIHTSKNRIRLIIDEVLKKYPEDGVLITFNEIVHGQFMFDEIIAEMPHEKIELVHGSTKKNNEAIDRFRAGETRILIASMIIKKGANIPEIDVLVCAQGGLSVITVKQVLGRGMRKKKHDRDLMVFDFYDTGLYLSKHSAKRARIYKKEELEIVYKFEQKRGHPSLETIKENITDE